ncbi:hypothetical protein, partial [Mycobacterium tuberculosis]|uniref:hypothetical protein n=1 Tax=Mycobacterium tuberculosis TaxID=1773 RepID=UPI001BE02676
MAIRYRSLFKWFVILGKRVSVISICLLVTLLIMTILVGLLNGKTLEPAMEIYDIELTQVIYHFIINGWLQIMNIMLIVLITAWIFKDDAKSLFILGVLALVCLPIFNVGGWIPSGL